MLSPSLRIRSLWTLVVHILLFLIWIRFSMGVDFAFSKSPRAGSKKGFRFQKNEHW